MENSNHEQAHTQNTETGNYVNYAPSDAGANSSVHNVNLTYPVTGTSQPNTVQIGQAVRNLATWGNTSGPIADWYYGVNTDVGIAMSRGVTTRIVDPELDGLKDTVATLKKELEEMKEKLKTSKDLEEPGFRKLSV